MRRALQLLHHPDDARRRPVAARWRRRSQTCDAPSPPGYKEIALTGVHLGSYGRDLAERVVARWAAARVWRHGRTTCCFASVRSSRWTARRRSSTWWPRRRGSRRTSICRLQHGVRRDAARACARPYTASHYSALVDAHSRALMPHASIGSDVIVGFPGETDAHFEESASLLRDLPLTHLHVFPYSDRPGTEASAMHGESRRRRSIRARGRRIRDIGARDGAAVPAAADRHHASGADRRRWLVGGDGQLPEGAAASSTAATQHQWTDVRIA